MFFVANLHFFVWVKMWVRRLTHTVTHTQKRNNGEKSAGQEIFLSCPFFLLFLYNLFHECPHGLGCLVLLLPRGVGVGAEGKSGIVMAQHAGHSLHVHTVLQGRGGEGMTEIMEADVWESGVFQDLLMEVYHGVRMVHLSSDGRGKHVRAVRVLAMILDQQLHRCLRDGH